MKTIFLLFFLPTLASAAYEFPNGKWYQEFFINGHSVWAEVMGAIVPPAVADELPLKEQITRYITTMAQFEGTDPVIMVALSKCESGLNPDAIGDKGKARGIFQWWLHSWNHYNAVYGTSLDRESWQDQAKMSAKVLADGGWENWFNCYTFVTTGHWPR